MELLEQLQGVAFVGRLNAILEANLDHFRRSSRGDLDDLFGHFDLFLDLFFHDDGLLYNLFDFFFDDHRLHDNLWLAGSQRSQRCAGQTVAQDLTPAQKPRVVTCHLASSYELVQRAD